MPLTPRTRLGPYEIVASLGAGGMGEVYRATDTKLGRDVALKMLPTEMARDAERLARFRREAKVLAQLDHPNIITIYSVEECDGIHFLTMQLVDGQPLDRLILQDGLPLERIIEIGSALADALSAAHEKGIVHRDLKPANVMISNESRVKVLDFGLAKDVRGSNLGDATLTSASQTEIGVVMGTPAYMSPEQTSGRPLDHRTDIFSFGVVLHEMATGRRPFEGTSSAELVSSILRDTPASVTDSRPDLPSDLARVIRRCLEKDPRHRLQTARDVSNEFRDLARTATRPPAASSSTVRAATKPDSGSAPAAVREDEGFWVAVLPFKYGGSNAELTALADGLTDDIITGMSRFSYLRVIARSSSSRYAGQSVDVRTAGKELSARYVIEGTLRQAGSKLRLAVQLVDSTTGTHLWAENYERAFNPEALFEIQDDLVPRIVSTVADYYGILPHTISDALRGKADDQLTPHEAVLRAFRYFERISPQEHAQVREILERAVRSAPGQCEIWAMLSTIYWHEHAFGFNPQPDPLERALAAARRSVDAAPTNNLGHSALAATLFFQKNILAFRPAAERAIELNRMDGSNLATMGMMMAYSGDWEQGCALVESALQLNPHHPGWYWFAHFLNAYRKGDYRGALSIALKFNLPGYFLAHALTTAVYGQLGMREPAQKELHELLGIRPDFGPEARTELEKCYASELVEHVIEGLRKAGLVVPETGTSAEKEIAGVADRVHEKIDSAAARAAVREDEGFWVAVLPFKHAGGNADFTALADGLTDDIITGMSRFSYLRVIARSSTAHYAQRAVDVRLAARELGARYVMEGSIRRAGAKVRIAVQLVDAASGTGLWAETYDRAFDPEATLDLLDDVVPRIVVTVGDTQGILAHSMTEALRNRDPASLTPYEALLRSFGFHQHVSAAEHLVGRTALEHAVKQAPDRADCWAMLSWLYRSEYSHGFNEQPDALDRALAAARRAVELAPSNQFAHAALASAFFFRREFTASRAVAERAVTLNKGGYATAFLGLLLAFSGDWERGCALAERSTQLNPNHPGWYWFPLVFNEYRKGDDQRALELALRINMPGFWFTYLALAVTYSRVGETEKARSAVRDLVRVRSSFGVSAQEELEKWWQPELVERMLADLRKAGLDTISSAALSGASAPRTASGETRSDEGFWVAVLPFKHGGNDTDLKGLAEGLSEEVITGLSRFSYLRVIARGSTAKYSSESGDVRAIGKELGARYVMEGTLRQAGNKLRLAVQLAEATTGSHLWAETYERGFNSEAVFELQDELVPRIVSTVADRHGVLPHSMSEAVQAKDSEQLTPYEAVLLSFSYAERILSEEQIEVKACLERAVAQVPGYADAWAMLAMCFCDEYGLGFKPQPSLLERALDAARRAVKAGPSNHLAYQNLAYAHFLRREFGPCKNAAERSLALNSIDGANVWFMGLLMAYMGDWERGCALVERAMHLNPNFPGKYRFPVVANAYRKGDYRAALDEALRMNLPEVFYTGLEIAAAAGQLGEKEVADKALCELLALQPDIAAIAREILGKWFQPELVQHFIEGLRKAGLEIPDADSLTPPAAATPARTASGETRADEGFWVAVLPFKYTGKNDELKALAEGLSEEIITGLSRFSYLRVIARGSTAKYSSESGDVRAMGKELGARYVMEGSLRHGGDKLRLAVQLVDCVSGAHLWAETYDRTFRPEEIFAVQDELVPRIVSTVADRHGVLPHTMSEAVRSKDETRLTPHEAVLRAFGYFERITPDEHAIVMRILERAVKDAPEQADCWAMLSMLYRGGFAQGFNPVADPLGHALTAAQRAVDAAPSNHLAYFALASTLFFRKDKLAFRVAAERCLELNPLDGSSMAFLGMLISGSGDWDRGAALLGSAMQLNPNHPGWYKFAIFYNAYHKREYRRALEAALGVNLPGYFHTHAAQAAAYGQLGLREAAQGALQHLLALRSDFAAAARQEYGKWQEPAEVEHLIDGLRKAGLEIPEEGASPATTSSAPPAPQTASGAAHAVGDEGFWVAVLPFKYTGNEAGLKSLAEGLSEEITTGLSRFSYLRVIARGSTAKYSSEPSDVRAIGKELGARYVMEGSLRQAGNKLRLAVQLVDAVSGAHLWADTYERSFTSEAVFEIQDDLVPRIVSTVADAYGILPYSMSEVVRNKALDQLTPYEAGLRVIGYGHRLTPEEHAVARTCLERAVQQAPNNADVWAMLSLLCADEYGLGFNPQPDPLGRALQAAQRATDAAPSSSLAQTALAKALFFRKEFQAMHHAAEQVISLNPMDGAKLAQVGTCLAYSGDWERGCGLMERAMQLNPRHPAWYWFPLAFNAYRKGDYRGSLNFALKINLPGFYGTYEMLAVSYAQLGERDAARQALSGMLKLAPNFGKIARAVKAIWFTPEMAEHMLDGMRKAGLEIPAVEKEDQKKVKKEDQKPTSSGAVSAAHSIAVLPFANMSDDKEQDYFSDGLAEEIINLLAQISGLKVIARTSAFAFRGKEQDIRGIAEALGVSTILEGSVRRSGNRIRVTAQLINAADGSHLWSERYDRELSDIFAVQDEISAAIAKALRVKLSREAAQQRYTPRLPAYEAYLKARYQQAKVTPESMELARKFYEQASELDPAFAMPHVGLGFYWFNLAHFGRHFAHECVPPARAEGERALQIDASLPEAHAMLGYFAAMYDMDWAAVDKHFEFPMAKQASFGLLRPLYGWVQFWRGDVEPAIELARRAIEEDPLEVWGRMNLHAYLQSSGREDEALVQLKKVLELDENQVVALVSMAMIYADKGDLPEALKIARRAYAVGPWSPDTIGILAGLTRRNGEEVEPSLLKALGSGEAPGDARAHALYHLLCGEIDQGADWVEKAVEQRDSSMILYLRFVVCRGLRASPRWPRTAKMINLQA